MTFTSDDIRWMTLALQEARLGFYTTDPNPRVGAVVVANGKLLATGFHARAGEPHAERMALNQIAGDNARGATCYVTLEPCCHTGRTGPCAEALIAAGIGRVVVAMKDPNPQVAGQGIERLRAAGIRVETGLLENEAMLLNPGFIKRHTQGLPLVRVKLAMSLDGRTAMASGESQWITGPAAREDVQRWRARSSAIITGIGTVLTDDPSLTVRPADWRLAHYGSEWVRQPLRVLLDSSGRVSAAAKILQDGNALVITATAEARDRLLIQGLAALAKGAQTRVDLEALLQELAHRECNEVLVEAGATLSAAFLEAGLVDELVVYQAPVLLGQTARPMLALDIATMAESKRLALMDERRFGPEHRFIFRSG